MFVVSLTYIADLTEVDRHLDAHVDYLKRHYADGTFLASGRKNPRTGGVILARAASGEALEAILAEDPFHIAGVARYEVTEFTPTMSASGLEGLLEKPAAG